MAKSPDVEDLEEEVMKLRKIVDALLGEVFPDGTPPDLDPCTWSEFR